MLMIQSTINILPPVFTYFVICLRNKNVTMTLKTVKFLCKTISNYWYATNLGIQIHCKDKTLYKTYTIFSFSKNINNSIH